MAISSSPRLLNAGLVAAVVSTMLFIGILPMPGGRAQAEFVLVSEMRPVEIAASMSPIGTASVDVRFGRSLQKTLAVAARADRVEAELLVQPAPPLQPVADRPATVVVVEAPAPTVLATPILTATGTLDMSLDAPRFPIVVSLNSDPGQEPLTVEERGEAALDTLDFDLAAIDYTISFHGPKPGYLGMAFLDRKHIEVYIRPSLSTEDLAFVVAHEVAHAVDHILNDADDRQTWLETRGFALTTPWWPAENSPDWGTPAGDFAECFASWLTDSPSDHVERSCQGTGDLMQLLADVDDADPVADESDDVPLTTTTGAAVEKLAATTD